MAINEVSYKARQIIDRLKASSQSLAVSIEYYCSICRDDGFVKVRDGYKPCQCKSKEEASIELQKPRKLMGGGRREV